MSGMRILIVEDEQKMARLLKKGLEEENHSVVLAHDGVEGLELSRMYPFDVIILDVMLPGTNEIQPGPGSGVPVWTGTPEAFHPRGWPAGQ